MTVQVSPLGVTVQLSPLMLSLNALVECSRGVPRSTSLFNKPRSTSLVEQKLVELRWAARWRFVQRVAFNKAIRSTCSAAT